MAYNVYQGWALGICGGFIISAYHSELTFLLANQWRTLKQAPFEPYPIDAIYVLSMIRNFPTHIAMWRLDPVELPAKLELFLLTARQQLVWKPCR